MKDKEKIMSEKDLYRQVAELSHENIRDIEYVFDIYNQILRNAIIQGQKIRITNLYTIETIECSPRDGVDFNGQKIHLDGFRKLKMTPSTLIKCEWTKAKKSNKENGEEGNNGLL